jgi:hypothetical protein
LIEIWSGGNTAAAGHASEPDDLLLRDPERLLEISEIALHHAEMVRGVEEAQYGDHRQDQDRHGDQQLDQREAGLSCRAATDDVASEHVS